MESKATKKKKVYIIFKKLGLNHIDLLLKIKYVDVYVYLPVKHIINDL